MLQDILLECIHSQSLETFKQYTKINCVLNNQQWKIRKAISENNNQHHQ